MYIQKGWRYCYRFYSFVSFSLYNFMLYCLLQQFISWYSGQLDCSRPHGPLNRFVQILAQFPCWSDAALVSAPFWCNLYHHYEGKLLNILCHFMFKLLFLWFFAHPELGTHCGTMYSPYMTLPGLWSDGCPGRKQLLGSPNRCKSYNLIKLDIKFWKNHCSIQQ